MDIYIDLIKNTQKASVSNCILTKYIDNIKDQLKDPSSKVTLQVNHASQNGKFFITLMEKPYRFEFRKWDLFQVIENNCHSTNGIDIGKPFRMGYRSDLIKGERKEKIILRWDFYIG